MTGRILVPLLAVLPCAAGPRSGTPGGGSLREGPRALLRNYALTVCLGEAFPAMAEEARAAAWAYLENGTASAEAHQEVGALAHAFLSRTYPSFSGARLDVLKCMDLFRSPDLDALVRKLVSGQGSRTRR